MKIKGKTVMVTGGSSGLGAASVERLHEAGANVVIADVNRQAGETLCGKLDERVAFAEIDLTAPGAVQSAVDLCLSRFGAVHVLVNCAGTGWAQKTVGKEGPHDLDTFMKVIRLNLVGSFDAIRLTAFRMQDNEPGEEGERGVIVNTASAAAFDGQVGQVAYAASKGGVVGMTLVVARDLARAGIRCCTIAPGLFTTPLTSLMPQEARDRLIEQTPFPNRFGQADEFAMMVQQIVENPFLNGETIRLDGALRMGVR